MGHSSFVLGHSSGLALGSSRLELPPATCRHCSRPVAPDAAVCPECGTAHPAEKKAAGYEWASAATWSGWPLVHVAFGGDAQGRPLVARGIVAIGGRAVGGIALGIVAGGGIAIGIVSVGLCSIGVVSVAAIAAFGVNALGPIAYGIVASGLLGGGAQFIGWKLLFPLAPPAQ
jgi:hypothetical protein